MLKLRCNVSRTPGVCSWISRLQESRKVHFTDALLPMDLATLSVRITTPSLQPIPFDRLLLFLALGAAIKSDISLIQPSDHPLAVIPKVLLHSAQVFLSHACGLSIDTIILCWSAFKDLAWCSKETCALLQASTSTSICMAYPMVLVHIC